ncbi:MAG: hypothetical protein FD138_2876, partial [Planctomycetota bacterium]
MRGDVQDGVASRITINLTDGQAVMRDRQRQPAEFGVIGWRAREKFLSLG